MLSFSSAKGGKNNAKRDCSKSKNNRIFKYLIIVIIFLAVIYMACGTTIISDLQGKFLNIITGNLTVSGNLTAKTGRVATLTVAASNSSAISKAQADYVCDGTDDQVEIQTAIDAVNDRGGGVVQLLEGDFYVKTSSRMYLRSKVSLKGTQGTRFHEVSGASDFIIGAKGYEFLTLDADAGNWKVESGATTLSNEGSVYQTGTGSLKVAVTTLAEISRPITS